jgi:hypothetical protein
MMSEDVSAIAQMVHDMMDETELRSALDTCVESIFARQLTEAFTFTTGPLDYWREVESEWRRVTGGDPIPTKYRTNKSVILKAYGQDANMGTWIGGDGEVYGKSHIQNTLSGEGKLTREGALKKIIYIIDKYALQSGDDEGKELCREVHIKVSELI